MKRSGIIRKIDNLGRLVIPREVRKLLNLNPGDEMEIFVGENNDVVFRKTNMEFCIDSYAYELGNKLYASMNTPVWVVSKTNVLEVFGASENLIGDALTAEVKALLDKKHYTSFNGGNGIKLSERSENFFAEIIMPVIKDGQSVGGVIITSQEYNFDMSHLKFLRLAVGILELAINEK